MKTNKNTFSLTNLVGHTPSFSKETFCIGASSVCVLGLAVLSKRFGLVRNALVLNFIRLDNLFYKRAPKIEFLDLKSIFKEVKGFDFELDIKRPTVEFLPQPQISPENQVLLSIFKNDVLGKQEVLVERLGEKTQIVLSNQGVDKKPLSSEFVKDLLTMIGLEQYAGVGGALSVTLSCPKVFEFTSHSTEEGTSIKFTDSAKTLSYEANIGKGLLSLNCKYAIEEIILSKTGEVSVKVASVKKDGSLTNSFPSSFGKIEGSCCPKIATFCSQIWS